MPRDTPRLDRYPIEDISQLADGHVAERFAEAVAEVAANIRDEHTSTKPRRRVTITVEFVSAQDRGSVQLLTNVTTKLAPKLGRTVPATFARDGETLEAFTTQQDELPGTARRGAPASVTALRAVNEGNG